MSEASRVQRWREGKRRAGLKALTVWLTEAEEMRLKDVALQRHCSPSQVLQEALALIGPARPQEHSNPPDTALLRELIRAELSAVQAAQAPVTDTVTEAVTATLARDLPTLVRQLVEGLALEALGFPATDTDSDVTDTEALEGATTPQEEAPKRGGRRGAMRQRIVALLGAHPGGLSAEQLRASLQPEKPLGDVLQGMRRQRVVHTRGQGREMVYVLP